MFDFVHTNKRLVQIVLAVIILPFAFWGVDSYTRSGNTANIVATVNDLKITQQEFANALRQQQDRLRQQLGDNLNPAMLDSPESKRAVVENLVGQRLMLAHAIEANLIVTDAQIAQVIGGIPAFQDGGKFDKKRYETVLQSQGISPPTFEARLRDDMLWQQIQNTYLLSGYASNSLAENIIRLNEQQRTVSVSPILSQSFIAKAEVNEEAMKNYYNQNLQEFQLKEQAKVEYVKFTVDGLLSKIDVSNEDVRKYYGDHPDEFGIPEERKAAHILVSVPANASKSQQEAAREKSEQLLQELRKTPAKFAVLAKQHSQDLGSAVNGGDLDYFGRGMMVKPFEDAAFALKIGEISELVKTDFGYHIIKLVAIKPPNAIPFEEARGIILDKLRQQKSADIYAEMAEKFSNAVYEQSDTLQPAADLIGAKVEQSGWLVNGIDAGGFWTSRILQAIFNDEVLKNKRNTAAVEVAPNTLVAARLLEYKPAAVRTFGEVQEIIKQKLLRQRAMELAAGQGRAMLAQLQSGGNPVLSWSPVQTISRSQYGQLDAELVKKIYQANAAKLPQYVGVEVLHKGYLLARIDAVKDGEVKDERKREQYIQQLRQMTGEEMFRAYLSDAKKNAAIKVNLPDDAPTSP